MNPVLRSDGNVTTVRTAAFADWIDGCVRSNIETALKSLEPYHVLEIVEKRPYHVTSAGVWLHDSGIPATND